MLALTLAYAELLRRYGTPGLVEWLFDGVRWIRDNLGAFPRPIEALLGIPALVWGIHMRARRRQGWWVCAFGVAATAPIAHAAWSTPRSSAASSRRWPSLYGLVVGLVVGFLLIRVDLLLTGTGRRRGEPGGGGGRPEPPRTRPLL